jgi:hypothetical protein
VKPVAQWRKRDEAFKSIAEGIRDAAYDIARNSSSSTSTPHRARDDKAKQNIKTTTPLDRMISELKRNHPKGYKWRTVEKLRVVGGLNSIDEALVLLREMKDVQLDMPTKGPNAGNWIAKLTEPE